MKKKIFFVILIILLLVFLGLLVFYIYDTYYCFTDVSAKDNSFKLTIPNSIKYKIKESEDENYLLDFYYTKDEMFFYSNVIEKKSEINLKDVVETEKNNLSSSLNNINNLSDIAELTINNYKSCKYSYIYSDSDYGKDLYSEVVWIETDTKIYILDLQVITKNMDKYKSIFEGIEQSFTINM